MPWVRRGVLWLLLGLWLGGCGSPAPAPASAVAPPAEVAPPAASSSLPGQAGPADLPAQRPAPRFTVYTVSDGLSSGSVGSILQDRVGFLWFATDNGLNRYDGAVFTPFTHDPDDPRSLEDNQVNVLYEDRHGFLWAGTETGVDQFDPATEAFTHYRHEPSRPDGLGPGAVRAIAEDGAGTLWVGTYAGGLAWFDRTTGAFVRVPHTGGGMRDRRILSLRQGPDGRLWVGTGGHLGVVDPATKGYQRIQASFGGLFERQDGLFSMAVAASGDVWAGSYDEGLFRYQPATGAVRHYPPGPGGIGHPWVLSVYIDPAGTVWAGTDGGGLHRYDPHRDVFDRVTHEAAEGTSLSDDRVLSIYQDRSGVLWVGTSRGLNRRLFLSDAVAQERARPGDPQSLSSDDITAMAEEADGVLWVGTDTQGLNRRDPATGRFERIRLDPTAPRSANTDAILSLAVDSAGTVWAGAYDGLFRREAGATRFTRFTVPDGAGREERFAVALTLAPGLAGRLWVGTQHGLFDVDPAARTLVHYRADPEAATRLSGEMAHALHARPDGTLWAVTGDHGLDRYDPATRTFSPLRTGTSQGQGRSTAMWVAHDGTVWLGTTDGLERYRPGPNGYTLKRFGAAEGMRNTVVKGVVEDRTGAIWLSTIYGLHRLDVRTETFQHYTVRDGFQSDHWNENALYRSPRTGLLYAGGDHGYNVFDPAALPVVPPPEPVVLTGLHINGEAVGVGAKGRVLQAPLHRTAKLRLGPKDNVVTLAFAALEYAAPAQHRYAVRLEGLHADWLDVGTRREVTFTELPPGRYTFRVRAAGRDGVWGTPSVPLVLTVAPPWWRAWWAYLAYALLAVGAARGYVRSRRLRIEQQHRLELEHLQAEQLRELDRAKSQFFANVSHEFRTPLMLTLGPLDDLQAGLHGPLPEAMVEQVDLARRNARRVLDLINQILDIARLEAGRLAVHARPLDLREVVAGLTASVQPLAERKGLALRVSVPEQPVAVAADPEHLEKILVNLLSNAVKFTPTGGEVAVAVVADAALALVTVQDSGPGIPPSDLPYVFDRFYRVHESAQHRQPGSGIGLALAKELAELHGGDLTAESTLGMGSTFTLALPLGRGDLLPAAPALPPATWEAGTDDPDIAWGDLGLATRHAVPADAEELPDDVTTVLVVEDHPEVRAYLRRHLEQASAPYHVIEASDGLEGLAKARARLPDLILSDVMMPGLDGYALCRALRADPETDYIPLILLTAKAGPEDRLEGLREHCDDYLVKPFVPAELLARIEALLAMRQRLRVRFGGTTVPTAASPTAPAAVLSADATWLARVDAEIETHLGDEHYSVERLAEGVAVSRAHLHRRLRELRQVSPSDLLRDRRLARAAALLTARAGTVSEIAYAVGFKSVAHFSNAFHLRYGCRPSAYAGETPVRVGP